MSWGFVYVGEAKEVAKKINDYSYFPAEIKAAIAKIAEKVPEDRMLYVESNGHHEIRLPEEKKYSNELSAKNGIGTANDGTPYDPYGGAGDIVNGSGVLTWKVLQKV